MIFITALFRTTRVATLMLPNLCLILVFTLTAFATPLCVAQENQPQGQSLHLRQPAWKSPIVYNESSILLKEGEANPKARLAFVAKKVLEVRSALTHEKFLENVHWKLQPSGNELEWIGTLPCAVVSNADLFPPSGAPNSYKHRASNPEQNLLYAPGKWFHERNIEITYQRTDEESLPKSESLPALKITQRKLQSKANLTIAISGDSISTGLDASATTATAPNQPGYPELLVSQLQMESGSKITLVNRSVPGWSIANGVQDLDTLLESKPDLLIVAYGMNDVGRRAPNWFTEQAIKIRNRARELLPDLEIIWVTPMLGNREWIHTPREMFFQYQTALRESITQAQAIDGKVDTIADVTQVWELMSKQKHDLDYTGNGLNHPNDFGHRLYAQTILDLIPSP